MVRLRQALAVLPVLALDLKLADGFVVPLFRRRLLAPRQASVLHMNYLNSLSPQPPDGKKPDDDKSTKPKAGKDSSYLSSLTPKSTLSQQPSDSQEIKINDTLEKVKSAMMKQKEIWTQRSEADEPGMNEMRPEKVTPEVSAAMYSEAELEESKAFGAELVKASFLAEEERLGDTMLEEKISMSLASAKSLGSTIKTYKSVRESLRESKARAQRSLSRSAVEKEKAMGKIARLKADMEADTQQIEAELQNMLDESQESIDKEMRRMSNLLQSDRDLEADRETQVLKLTKTLEEAIAGMEKGIESEKSVTAQMLAVRSNLKVGNDAAQLDSMIDHKQALIAVEQTLVDDLLQCLSEMKSVLADGRARATRLEAAVKKLVRPKTRDDTTYEWSDIEEMEQLLELAADNAAASDKRINKLSEQVYEAFVKRDSLLGENSAKGTTGGLSFPKRNVENKFKDMQGKETNELVGIATNSLGKAVTSASKLLVFEMKAFLESATGQSVSEAAKEVVEKSSGFSSGVRDLTDAVKQTSSAEDLAKNQVLREKAESTASVLNSVGKTGKALVGDIGKSGFASKANDELKDTSENLVSTFNALAALSVKLVEKGVKQVKNKRMGNMDEILENLRGQKKD